MTTNNRRPSASIRTIWGIAKSPELQLNEEALYQIVFRETGKKHMKDLTQGEIETVVRVLTNLRESKIKQKPRRTDEGGNPKTVSQRRKIYALCEVLGWNRSPSQINGFVKRVCGVDRIEWLSPGQCYQVIEALKKIIERRGEDGQTKENAYEAGTDRKGKG
ncbi:MAG: regulatory protein GemA [Hungatella sp.]|jgi:hypothetical protein|nr:regulatory protein GemA [Hungatella sp.]